MDLKIDPDTFFVFDLDDTLFNEVDFLKSAYRSIGQLLEPYIQRNIAGDMLMRYYNGENVFEWVISRYKSVADFLNLHWLLQQYREHKPVITLREDAADFLARAQKHNIPAGLITDGRSITQRNKLRALGLERYFNDVIISEEFGSEKPDIRNYQYFKNQYPGRAFHFFGDNTGKDFSVPYVLGWATYCIKDAGRNIHKQQFDAHEAKPQHIVASFSDIILKCNGYKNLNNRTNKSVHS